MEAKEILIKIIKAGIVLVFFTPLVLGPFGLNMSEYPKAIFFRSLIEILLAFYIFLLLTNKKYLPKLSPVFILVLIFDAGLIVSSLLGVNFYRSFFGDMQRGEGIILHLHLLAFFIILISMFKKREDWLLPLRATVVVSGLSSMAAILQQFKIFKFYNVESVRLSGTLSNPDFFGSYLVLSIFLTIFLLACEKRKKLKALWISLIVLNFYTLIFSGTRASWIGFALGVVVVYFLNYKNLNYKKRICSLLVVLFISITALFLPAVIQKLHLENNSFSQRVLSIYNLDIGNRLDIWKPAIMAFKDRPYLGWGYESFSFVSDKYFKSGHVIGIYFDRPHNKIIEMLVYGGAMGIISYLLIFFALFYLILKYAKSWDGSLILAFFVSGFAQSFFSFDHIGTYILFFLAAGFVNNNFFKPSAETPESPDKKMSAVKIILFVDAVMIIAFVLYQINIWPTAATMYFVEYIKYEPSNPVRALGGYRKGVMMNTVYDNDLTMAFAERSVLLLENSYGSGGIGDKAVDGLLEIEPVLRKNIMEKAGRPNNVYEFLLRTNEWAYIIKKKTSYLDNMEKDIDQAMAFNNSAPVFYRLKGEMEILQNKNSDGEKDINKSCDMDIIGCNGKRAKADQMVGIAYFKKGDIATSLKNFQKSLDGDYNDRKKLPYSVISAPNPAWAQFIDSVAIMYYGYSKDFESCKKVYEQGMEAYPYHKSFFEQRLFAIIQDHNR